MTKYGAAYFAASQLTRRAITVVATAYLEWIDDKGEEETAIDALLGAANWSKNHEQVLARAEELYEEIGELADES